MRKLFVFSLSFCLLALASTAQSRGYRVKVKIDNPSHYPMYLAYAEGADYKVDTSFTMEDGAAVFTGKVKEPTVAAFGFRGNPDLMISLKDAFIPGPNLNFFLSNEDIEIEGTVPESYKAKVSGGVANQEWASIKEKQTALEEDSWKAARQAYGHYDPEVDVKVFNDLSTLRAENMARDEAIRADFIKKHPASLVSMYFLYGLVNELSLDTLKVEYDQLSSTYKSSKYGRAIATKIANMEATAIGKQAIDFKKLDMNGKPVSLSSMQGKYVLVDFWGSWCGPCRESHPHLKALYNKYKDQGFEIIGIAQEQSPSMDYNEKAWKNAVLKDGLPWLQVLNNQDLEKQDIVKDYGISAFPTKLLVDKKGVIIQRFIGEDTGLDQALEKLFGF